MRFNGSMTTALGIGNNWRNSDVLMQNGFISRKFKNNCDIILNSGNFYFTLQFELCPYIS